MTTYAAATATLRLLDLLAGGDPEMGKHHATDGSTKARKAAQKATSAREEGRPNYTAFPAPKCPHGHFERWARGTDLRTGRPNCKGCSK